MRITRAAVAGAILSLCGMARADDALSTIEKWLSAGIEPVHVDEQVLALGRAGEEALWTLYGDASKSRVVRLRALSELALFATPRTAGGLASMVRAPRDELSRSPLALRRALDGLSAIAERTSTGVQAGDLVHLLAHPDAHVRKSAAKLLALVDGDVQPALSQLAERDPSHMVRSTAQRAQATRANRQAAVRASERR